MLILMLHELTEFNKIFNVYPDADNIYSSDLLCARDLLLCSLIYSYNVLMFH